MTKYTVWNPDHGSEIEDGREVHAHSPEAAAEAFAQRDDAESADYLIVGGNPATLKVSDGSNEWVVLVTGEAIAEYRGRVVAGAPLQPRSDSGR